MIRSLSWCTNSALADMVLELLDGEPASPRVTVSTRVNFVSNKPALLALSVPSNDGNGKASVPFGPVIWTGDPFLG